MYICLLCETVTIRIDMQFSFHRQTVKSLAYIYLSLNLLELFFFFLIYIIDIVERYKYY